MLKLQYINANAEVPMDRVSSTARKGDKWFNQVGVGDVVEMVSCAVGHPGKPCGPECRVMGHAAVVAKELVTYKDVLENAEHNHVGVNRKFVEARHELKMALMRAYGPLKDDDQFTVLHILPLRWSDSCVAAPGEPRFTLLARDVLSSTLVSAWIEGAKHTASPGKIGDAAAIRDAMEAWPTKAMPS